MMRPVQSITGVIRGWPVKIVWIEERTGREHVEGRGASGRERRMDVRAASSPTQDTVDREYYPWGCYRSLHD